ncbi:hypothetical protein DFP72DRAFT_1069264 [Ephemerocybe angulata]|uniref:Uncharacterized protein n=1 Tax=Ephemerocybe angulata TaxID=980116 RepID=A0A8H6HV06_9AGAR|nr:hypothetical protein DFP72DRAFT_1069264 [Tulosesus angulatus]
MRPHRQSGVAHPTRPAVHILHRDPASGVALESPVSASAALPSADANARRSFLCVYATTSVDDKSQYAQPKDGTERYGPVGAREVYPAFSEHRARRRPEAEAERAKMEREREREA